ncbi:hypothetical protein ZWY2020_050116 [Hordeum vulgare]|nr:hypothetical protein ZWY2020_050116 [Hordeum vulgare]
MEGEGVQPPPVLVVEEVVVVQPPPLVQEVVVVQPPLLVVEEEVVVQPPPLVEEEVVVVQPPLLEVEEEVVVQPPPLVEEEEVVVQPPPLVEEEVVVVQPPLVEEEEVVVQPPLLVEEEEVVVQPPPLMEEEEVVVQPPPLVEEKEEEEVQELPDPDPYALALRSWTTAMWEHAEHYMDVTATGLNDVINLCEAARVTLREVSAVLVDEPIDAAETIYTALLDAVSRGTDLRLIGPAANIVDRLFNWPGPLAGAMDVAGALVHDTFDDGWPEGGPLQAARRMLGYLVDDVHASAGIHFHLFASALGVDVFPAVQGAFDLWVANHIQADAQARVALQWLNKAVNRSLGAGFTVHLCGIMPASRVRPGGGLYVPLAELMLPQTIGVIDDALVALHEMRDTLVQVLDLDYRQRGHTAQINSTSED